MDTTKKLTKLEIIQDTVAYYSQDPVNRRSIDIDNKGRCLYAGPNGMKCALARWVKDECMAELTQHENHIASDVFKFLPYDILKPEAHHPDSIFWNNLQTLHDTHIYWDDKGLTKAGKIYLDKITQTYKAE